MYFFLSRLSRHIFLGFIFYDHHFEQKKTVHSTAIDEFESELCSLETDRNNIPTALNLIDVIGVCLHHLPALLLELFTVVGFPVFIIRSMRKLTINDLMSIAKLRFNDPHRQRSKAVTSVAALISHAPYRH